MAKVRDRHLGTIQGAVGDQVFKVRSGESYLAELPHLSGKTPSVKSVNARKKFGNTGKFASAVNGLPSFKNLWDNVTPDRISPYNGIFKANYPFISSSDVTDLASIVPFVNGFSVTTTTVSVSSTEIEVAIAPIGTNAEIDTSVELYIQLGAVIKCSDPVADTVPGLYFIPVKSDNLSLNLTTALDFTATLSNQSASLYGAYSTHKTYLGLVTLTVDGKAVHFSSGFVH